MTPPEGPTVETRLAAVEHQVRRLEAHWESIDARLVQIADTLIRLDERLKQAHAAGDCHALREHTREIEALWKRLDEERARAVAREEAHEMRIRALENAQHQAQGAGKIAGMVWGILAGVITAFAVAAIRALSPDRGG
jgi:predicted RNase H-like nuclease (RuvC/YqgF family)